MMDVDMVDNSSTETVTTVRVQFKGKAGNRGWATLPQDVLILVLNHIIREYNVWPMPICLSTEASWASRMIFTAARTACMIEPYLTVCRPWRLALNNHPFWSHVVAVLDPGNQVATLRRVQLTGNSKSSKSVPVIRLDHAHYHWVKATTCIPCRMLDPSFVKEGFTNLKRLCQTMHTGAIGCCRDHKVDLVCGVCLRSDKPQQSEYCDLMIQLIEDDESFPSIEATCARCRLDMLWTRAPQDRVLQASVREYNADRNRVDWEIRQAIDQYVDFGEGTISGIIKTAWEKTWLRNNTKISEYLDQAVASVRFQNREDGYESEDEISDDEDVLCYQEEAGVREIAMSDFCRGRIVDGAWTIPYDMYVALTSRRRINIIPAQSPVPYMHPGKQGEVHPSVRNAEAIPPPTHELAQQLSHAFHKEMREVLDPALKNLVRKIVLECTRNRMDVCVRASKMTVEDIIQGLRHEGVWWENYDWVARWLEDERMASLNAVASNAAAATATGNPGTANKEEDDATSSNTSSSECSHGSTGSAGSHETSPVLSTTTLQTTPSPPPVEGLSLEKEQEKAQAAHAAAAAASIPVKTPSIVRIVPFVPESAAMMPQNTRDLLRQLWREACAPLFHCKCCVCTRAMQAEQANAAAAVMAATANNENVAPGNNEEVADDMIDPELQQAIAFERQLNARNQEIVVPSQKRIVVRSASPEPPSSRKRSSEEVESDNVDLEDMQFTEAGVDSSPKRIKLDSPERCDTPSKVLAVHARKRSSEEMESGDSTPNAVVWTKELSLGNTAPVPTKKKKSGDEYSTSTPRAFSKMEIEPEDDDGDVVVYSV